VPEKVPSGTLQLGLATVSLDVEPVVSALNVIVGAVKTNCISLPISTQTQRQYENGHESSMCLIEKNAKKLEISCAR